MQQQPRSSISPSLAVVMTCEADNLITPVSKGEPAKAPLPLLPLHIRYMRLSDSVGDYIERSTFPDMIIREEESHYTSSPRSQRSISDHKLPQ